MSYEGVYLRGFIHDRAPCNGDNIAVPVYQDSEGHWYVEACDRIAYVGPTKPKEWRVFKTPLDAKVGPLVAAMIRADEGRR